MYRRLRCGEWLQGLDHALQDGNRPLGVAIRVEIAGLGQRGRRLGWQPARVLDLQIAAADLLDAEALRGEGAGDGEERRQDDHGELVARSHCYSTTRTVPSRLSAMKIRARASTAMSSGARNSWALGEDGSDGGDGCGKRVVDQDLELSCVEHVAVAERVDIDCCGPLPVGAEGLLEPAVGAEAEHRWGLRAGTCVQDVDGAVFAHGEVDGLGHRGHPEGFERTAVRAVAEHFGGAAREYGPVAELVPVGGDDPVEGRRPEGGQR